MNESLAVLLAFVASGFFSAMETAFTAFNRLLAVSWLRHKKFGARAAYFMSAHPERFLGTTLIGNNIAHVAYSSLAVMIAAEYKLDSLWLMTASPLLVLIFAEIIPKSLGFALANLLTRIGAWPLLICHYLFWPLRLLLLPVMRILGGKHPEVELISGEPLAFRRDLELILSGAEAEGTVTPHESEILSRYLDARDLKVRQIMTPRTQMIAVSVDEPPDKVRERFLKYRYSVLPVFERDMDHIIGYVRARDVLFPHPSVRDILRPIYAVPESKKIIDLLREFKSGRHQIALVIDEYGGTDGFVTLRDIFEELVGPVDERWEADESVIKRIAQGKFLISGSALLEDIAEITGWNPTSHEANTLSGLITEKLGRIAELGEDVDMDGVIVRIIRRSPTKIEGCLVKVPPSMTHEAENGA